jgi:hypothetical protein
MQINSQIDSHIKKNFGDKADVGPTGDKKIDAMQKTIVAVETQEKQQAEAKQF